MYLRVAIFVVTSVFSAACIKSSSTEPSDSNAITFSSATNAPVGQSVGLTATPGPEEGVIRVTVQGYNLRNDFNGQGPVFGVNAVLGRVKWDGNLLELTGAPAVGAFFTLNGVPGRLCTAAPSGEAIPGSTHGFCVATPAGVNAPPAMGTGELYSFSLRVREGVTSGLSPLDFIEADQNYPGARLILSPTLPLGNNPRHTTLDNYYGGTIRIR